jgi:A/G-specific adenine glycosylase
VFRAPPQLPRKCTKFINTLQHKVLQKGKKPKTRPNITALVAWYRRFGRPLPWRATQDPYAIWVSEIILQQTRIDQGTAYYHRFLAQFPTLEALAQASLSRVLKAWEGLGYYSRARNLHRAAQMVVQAYNGRMPQTHQALAALPGIGPYTARAIASLAFGQTAAVVDGNVLRVISRWLADATPIDQPIAKKHYQQLADAWLGAPPNDDQQFAAHFNQAMMDLGATVCTPLKPACGTCPIRTGCHAAAAGTQTDYPVKAKKKSNPNRFFDFYLIGYDTGTLVVRQRTHQKLWNSLWEIPNDEVTSFATPPVQGQELFRLKHVFTHFTMHMRVVALAPKQYKLTESEKNIALDAVPTLAFSRGVLKILQAAARYYAAPQGLFAAPAPKPKKR